MRHTHLLIYASSACLLAAGAPGRADDVKIGEFASGDRFYLMGDSFQTAGNGTITYRVRGEAGNPAIARQGQLMSENTVDCKTGQIHTNQQSWTEDAQGNRRGEKTGNPNPITLSRTSALYGPLKEACRRENPDLKLAW